jgi:hypothetical protein
LGFKKRLRYAKRVVPFFTSLQVVFQRINRFHPPSGNRSHGVLWLVLISYCLIWLHPFIHPLLMTNTLDFQPEASQSQPTIHRPNPTHTTEQIAAWKDDKLVECAVCKQIGANPPFQTHVPTLDFRLPPVQKITVATRPFPYRFQYLQPPARAPPRLS